MIGGVCGFAIWSGACRTPLYATELPAPPASLGDLPAIDIHSL